jgi:hypothetical protein
MNRSVPAVEYVLWNPNAAVRWSLLLSPAFGACLQASNWRAMGEPGLARTNMLWVWATFVFLALNAATLFISMSKTADGLTRIAGILLWFAWYWAQGRVQVAYVRDYGGNYVKKGWSRPLLAAVLAIALYFVVCFALVYATLPSPPKSREPAALAAWIEPRILSRWQENPTLHDAAIQKVVFDRKDGDTYTGLVEATFGGIPLRFAVTLDIGDDQFEWKLKALHDGHGNGEVKK